MDSILCRITLIMATCILLAACSKEPPKCSDENTITLVKQIIIEQVGPLSSMDKKETEQFNEKGGDFLNLELPRPSAYDKGIKKYSCEAKLIAGDNYQLPITYTSQLDDNGRHIVSVVSGMDLFDAISVQQAIVQSIANSLQSKDVPTPTNPQTDSKKIDVPPNGNNGKETVPPDDVYDLYIARHPTLTDYKPQEPVEIKTTRNDITYKHRDTKGDGHQAWYLYTYDLCGSGGCSGEIYIYENGKYCYAGHDEFDKFFNSNKIFPDLSCNDIKDSDIDSLGEHPKNLAEKYRIDM